MTMPEGAQVSDDGHYFWDEKINVWKPVVPGQGDGGTGQDQATAEFIFDTNGIWVDPDDTDNPDNHAVLHHDAGTQLSFIVWNVGAGNGSPEVDIYVDDQIVATWRTTTEVPPNQSIGPDGDGFVHGLGRHPAGRHVFRATVAPGHSGGGDDTTNEVDIE
jgi:hypothetical protein